MSCCTDTNNKTCPSKMADGRAFTDYRPRCHVNAELFNNLVKNNIIQSSYESRMYLQNNAEKIIDNDRDNAIQRLYPCAPCKRNFNDSGTMLPEKYIVRCDATTCYRTEFDPNGLGDGRK